MKMKYVTPTFFKHLTTSAALFVLFVCTSTIGFAYQDTFTTVSGEVIDSQTKKPLVFATLTVENTNISTVTNSDGEFSIKIPEMHKKGTLVVTFLGYEPETFQLTGINQEQVVLSLKTGVIVLSEVDITVPQNAKQLVKDALSNKDNRYLDNPTVMTAFYRETIKRRRKNVSLAEAIVSIYKSPYQNDKRDAIQLEQARKSTDYSKLDTVALKLQGGPFNTLYIDVIKYPTYVFSEEAMDNYQYTFLRSKVINDQRIYVIGFKQYEEISTPLYEGELYIDVDKKVLTSAVFSLNITDKEAASKLFVRKKPANARVWPERVAYRIDYREKNGKWFYGYSNVQLEFKVDWDDKLFNSVYTLTSEMAVTDWRINTEKENIRGKEKYRTNMVLVDKAAGFENPDFWGTYNIIEPEKSIESAIKKIQRQLRRNSK